MFQDGNSVVIVADFDVIFFGAGKGVVVVNFVGEDDFVTFVANTGETMLTSIKDGAAHEDFGMN